MIGKKHVFRWPTVVATLALLMVALAISARLPSLDGRSQSTRLVDTADTLLGRGIQPFARAHPGLSGVLPLARGLDALSRRLSFALLARVEVDPVEWFEKKSVAFGESPFTEIAEAIERFSVETIPGLPPFP